MSPQLNVPKSKGVTVGNQGSGYPPKMSKPADKQTTTEKPDSTSKDPYANYFSKRKDLAKKGKKAKMGLYGKPIKSAKILRRGWSEEEPGLLAKASNYLVGK